MVLILGVSSDREEVVREVGAEREELVRRCKLMTAANAKVPATNDRTINQTARDGFVGIRGWLLGVLNCW